MAQRVSARPLRIWPSVARLAATTGIFVFHYLGLLGRYQYHLDLYAIVVFCFLSGYLAHLGANKGLTEWTLQRYFAIMLPHWLVIFPVILANKLYHYKDVSTLSVMVTILGGSIFLANPLYVITWYVTFVLLLYAYALLDHLATPLQRIVLFGLGLAVFSVELHRGYYFVAFFIGLRLSNWNLSPRREVHTRHLATALFRVQQYCYPFFLVHGAVLLFFLNRTALSGFDFFSVAFVTSAIFAVLVYVVAKPLQVLVVGKLLGLSSARTSRRIPA